MSRIILDAVNGNVKKIDVNISVETENPTDIDQGISGENLDEVFAIIGKADESGITKYATVSAGMSGGVDFLAIAGYLQQTNTEAFQHLLTTMLMAADDEQVEDALDEAGWYEEDDGNEQKADIKIYLDSCLFEDKEQLEAVVGEINSLIDIYMLGANIDNYSIDIVNELPEEDEEGEDEEEDDTGCHEYGTDYDEFADVEPIAEDDDDGFDPLCMLYGVEISENFCADETERDDIEDDIESAIVRPTLESFGII